MIFVCTGTGPTLSHSVEGLLYRRWADVLALIQSEDFAYRCLVAMGVNDYPLLGIRGDGWDLLF